MGHHHSHHQKNNTGSVLLAFVAGAAAASLVGGYLFFGPEGRRNRRKAERWVEHARSDIIEKMRDARDITEDAYYEIVDQVLEKYFRMNRIRKEKLTDATDYFKERWEEMKEAAEVARREAELELEYEEKAQGR